MLNTRIAMLKAQEGRLHDAQDQIRYYQQGIIDKLEAIKEVSEEIGLNKARIRDLEYEKSINAKED